MTVGGTGAARARDDADDARTPDDAAGGRGPPSETGTGPEGLQLQRSDNSTGFKGVHRDCTAEEAWRLARQIEGLPATVLLIAASMGGVAAVSLSGRLRR